MDEEQQEGAEGRLMSMEFDLQAANDQDEGGWG